MIAGIRGRAIFTQLRSQGQRVRSGAVRMTFCPQADPQPRVAFAFGRKFGTAVERNRARRRLRAAFEQTWDPATGPAGAFLLTGSRALLTADFDRLRRDVAGCLHELQATGQRATGPESPEHRAAPAGAGAR